MQRSRVQITSLIILFLFGVISASAQVKPFHEWVSDYEKEMVRAVGLWKKNEYGSAMDRLRSARDIVSENIPKPTDYFKWYASVSMKTYALVLIRMIEIEVVKKEEMSGGAEERITQMVEWGEKLKDQARAWSLVEDVSPADSAMRETWIRRYVAVLKRVVQLKKVAD